jgi:hypothetical protein
VPTEVTVAPDASALLTASAAAAGALVAIVGGFLISRLVALLSEKEGLERRLRTLLSRLALESDRQQAIRSERAAVSREWFEDGALDDVILAVKADELDAEKIADEHAVRGMDWDESLQAAKELAKHVQEAVRRLREDRAAEAPSGEEKIYRRVYGTLYPLPFDEGLIAGTWIPTSDTVYQRQDQRIRDEQTAQAEMDALGAEIGIVQTEVETIARPRGVVAAIGILAYFAAGSVILPLILLAQQPVTNSSVIKALVIFLFVSGLALLIGFLIWSALQLRREPDQTPVGFTPERSKNQAC